MAWTDFCHGWRKCLNGYRKVDPPTIKELPGEVEVPKLLVNLGLLPKATEPVCAIGDWALIAFFPPAAHWGVHFENKQEQYEAVQGGGRDFLLAAHGWESMTDTL
mmetsp:Transcript_10550/g.19169  ORF Transcript_10550/g.19169 Transcript_10550/m.19169 type:complete len:105 (+) Transcript_10550:238-552(+)